MIYICIPTHNEQQTVGVVLWKLKHVLTDFPRDYQLLVADDASTDKTADVLEPYTRVLPLTVIRSEKRQGWAASLEMLLREAVRRSEYPKRDVIVTLQADFSEEPDDMVPLVKRLEAGADVAVGNKVSTSRETRARRFARSLARFFMRRQKWPEGVMSPFEGYRAYRLYAVKRAIEDRAAARLIRHEGWAGHAELLKAVLPHARRVDVVDIDDRPDRLQRPRREKPFASAMQVRVLAAGTEPPALTGVEELDRIALTASRSRDRGAITPHSINAASGATARTNGSRSRQPSNARRDQSRSRSQSNGTGRSRSGTGEDRQRPERDQTEARTRKKSPEGRSGPGRSRREEGGRKPRQPEGAAPAGEQPAPGAVPDQGAAAPEAAQRPKRKRRRRKRSGQGGATGSGQDQNALQPDQSEAEATGRQAPRPAEVAQGEGPAAEDGTAPDASGGSEESGTGGKKRRRRGGRRGGRGRRKPRPEGSGGEDTVGTEGASIGVPEGGNPATTAPPPERPVAEPAARAEHD